MHYERHLGLFKVVFHLFIDYGASVHRPITVLCETQNILGKVPQVLNLCNHFRHHNS